ncbi:MAG: hypothetical protein ACKVP7_01110 [Hyphomicrobiaceae bacterium]
MKVHTEYWHWAGALMALCAATLTVSAPRALSQEAAPAPGPAAQEAPAEVPAATPDAPAAPNLRQPSTSPRGAAAPTAPRRRLDSDGDSPGTNFDQLASPPAKGKVLEEPPHPLAAAYPFHNVVVCVAGCRTPTPGIVFIAPRATSSTAPGTVTLSSAGAASGEPAAMRTATTIDCVAGCYTGRKSYPAPASAPKIKARETSIRRAVPTAQTAGIVRSKPKPRVIRRSR